MVGELCKKFEERFASFSIGDNGDNDEFTTRIMKEARKALEEEPELRYLLNLTVLAPWVKTFEDAVASTVCYRMLLHPCDGKVGVQRVATMFCPDSLREIFKNAFDNTALLEAGHTMKDAVRRDAFAVIDRDPACETLLEVVLFYKGFASLVCHRAARQKWISMGGRRSMTALFLQSQCSAVFAVDIHPGATIGAAILMDHGTGIVIGETASIGDGCTLLHGVTLGGTGKEAGDRHPKVGNHVLIGAGTSILGNITVGDKAKIGAGSIVLRPIPKGATAVGAPAKIIGRVPLEENPASDMDEKLSNVSMLHKSISLASITGSDSIASITESDTGESKGSNRTDGENNYCCPFRDYSKSWNSLKLSSPSHSITFCMVAKHLKSKGCTNDEIGATFFALDTKCVGYVRRDSLTSQEFTAALNESTALSKEQIQSVLEDLGVE